MTGNDRKLMYNWSQEIQRYARNNLFDRLYFWGNPFQLIFKLLLALHIQEGLEVFKVKPQREFSGEAPGSIFADKRSLPIGSRTSQYGEPNFAHTDSSNHTIRRRTGFQNNLRWITSGTRPICGMKSSTLCSLLISNKA